MPQTIEVEVNSIEIDPTALGPGVYILKVTYSGEENLTEEIIQGELLSIEIPSHAPPPEE